MLMLCLAGLHWFSQLWWSKTVSYPFPFSVFQAEGASLQIRVSIISEHALPWPDPITFPSAASIRQMNMWPALPGVTWVCGGEQLRPCPCCVAFAVVSGEDRDSPHPTPQPSSTLPIVLFQVSVMGVQKFKELEFFSRLSDSFPLERRHCQCPWIPGKAPMVVPLLVDVSHTFKHWISGKFSEDRWCL